MSNQPEKNEIWLGHETAMIRLRLTLKAWFEIALIPAGVQFAIWSVWVLVNHSGIYYRVFHSIFKDGVGNGLSSMASSSFIFGFARLLLKTAGEGGHVFFLTLPVWLAYPVLLFWFRRFSENLQRTEHVKGAQVVTVKELKESIGDKDTNIKLKVAAEIPDAELIYEPKDALTWPALTLEIPRFIETRNFALVGKAGSGKSTVLFQVADAILARKEPGIYHDPHGDFVTRFYNEERGDIIFNPFDSRFAGGGWTVFNDLSRVTDYEIISNVLIPEPKGSADPYWFLASRQIFTAILKAIVQREPFPKNRHIVSVLNAGGFGIREYIWNSSPDVANMHLADPEGKTAASLLSVLLAYTKPLEYLPDGDFSITDYLENHQGRQIFVTNQADLKQALKPLNTVFFELLGTRLLSMKPDESRRTWVILDEVFALNKLKIIERLPVEGRKFGVSLILGAQDFSQGDELYTAPIRRSIFNSLASVFFFSVQDTATAKEISDSIGGHVFSEISRTESGGIGDSKDGYSLTRQRKTENRILPSEVSALRVFEHFLKLDGYPYCHSIIIPKNYPLRAETFQAVTGLDIDAVQAGATRAEAEGALILKHKAKAKEHEAEPDELEAPAKEDGFDPAEFDAADIINTPAPATTKQRHQGHEL